jgi:putative sigma-54 modulation protein
MEIQLTAKQIKITPALSEYVRNKVEKAQKYFDHIVWGQVFLSVEKRAHNAELIIHAPGSTFRVLATASDLYAAIDLASDKIDGQLKKFKEKLKTRHRQSARELVASLPVNEPAPVKTTVVRQEVFPITVDQAVEEMESLGLDFRLYMDRDTHQIHVVFRRDDDSYGVLQPVKKGVR